MTDSSVLLFNELGFGYRHFDSGLNIYKLMESWDKVGHPLFVLGLLTQARVVVQTGFGSGHPTMILLESLHESAGEEGELHTFELNMEDSYTEPKRVVELKVNKLREAYGLRPKWQIHIGDVRETALQWDPSRKIDLVYLDSDHGYEVVMSECVNFGQHMSEHGIICSHDTWTGTDYGVPARAMMDYAKWMSDPKRPWKFYTIKHNPGLSILVR